MPPNKYKELADAAEAAAEAEPPDEDETGEEEEGQPEPSEPAEPPETPAPEEPSAEQQVKLLDAAVRRFEKALAKLFGVEPPLVPVQLEGAIGFMLPGALEMRAHADFQRCATCNGWGQVLTGSAREGEQTADCPDPRCRGRGYWKKSAPPPAAEPSAVAAQNGPREEWEQPAWMGDPGIQSGPPAPPPPVLYPGTS